MTVTPLTHSSDSIQSFSLQLVFLRTPISERKFSCRCSFPIHLQQQPCPYSVSVNVLVPFDTDTMISDSPSTLNQLPGVVIPLATTRIPLSEVLSVSRSVHRSEATEDFQFTLPRIEGDGSLEEDTVAALERLQSVCDAIDGLSHDLIDELNQPSVNRMHPLTAIKADSSKLLLVQSTKVIAQSPFGELKAPHSEKYFTKVNLQSGSLPLLVEIHSECCEIFLAALRKRMMTTTEFDFIPEYNQSHKYSAPRDVQEMISECDLLISDLNAVEDGFGRNSQESFFRRIFALYKRARAKTF